MRRVDDFCDLFRVENPDEPLIDDAIAATARMLLAMVEVEDEQENERAEA